MKKIIIITWHHFVGYQVFRNLNKITKRNRQKCYLKKCFGSSFSIIIFSFIDFLKLLISKAQIFFEFYSNTSLNNNKNKIKPKFYDIWIVFPTSLLSKIAFSNWFHDQFLQTPWRRILKVIYQIEEVISCSYEIIFYYMVM